MSEYSSLFTAARLITCCKFEKIALRSQYNSRSLLYTVTVTGQRFVHACYGVRLQVGFVAIVALRLWVGFVFGRQWKSWMLVFFLGMLVEIWCSPLKFVFSSLIICVGEASIELASYGGT
eukprot:2197595-Amphidinium_carterae.1